jgi:hypothetical protein
VYDVNNDRKYVIKVVKDKSLKHQFIQELKYGTQSNLRAGIHVRIHAFDIRPNGTGVYVMDHVSFGAKDVHQSITAERYMKQKYFDKTRFIKKFEQALRSFYRTFKGFHGDLHAQNVMVNLRADRSLKNVVIIDYANIQPFTGKTLKNAHKAFVTIDIQSTGDYPVGSGIPVKWVHNETIPVRSNKNMLTRLPKWKPIRSK